MFVQDAEPSSIPMSAKGLLMKSFLQAGLPYRKVVIQRMLLFGVRVRVTNRNAYAFSVFIVSLRESERERERRRDRERKQASRLSQVQQEVAQTTVANSEVCCRR